MEYILVTPIHLTRILPSMYRNLIIYLFFNVFHTITTKKSTNYYYYYEEHSKYVSQ